MDANALNLPVNTEFALHAAAFAIRDFDRDDLEEAFLELLRQKAIEKQLFLNILKDHGIDADITLNFATANQVS